MRKGKLEAIFLLLIILMSIVAASFPLVSAEETDLVLFVQTDKPFYYFDQVVVISGFVQDLNGISIADARLGIEVKDPRDNTIFLGITYSTFDGTYEDSFRLPSTGTVGPYNVYVTAYKPGFQSASEQTRFYVSVEEIGDTTISITNHDAFLEGNSVSAVLNVTMLSNTLTSLVVTNRLICVNPNGTIVYDNFHGISTITDYKLTTIQNNSIATINYQFSLLSPTRGYHTCLFAVYDGYGSNLYDSTPWIPAFLYTPPPKLGLDLGSMGAEDILSSPLTLTLHRFEIAEFYFTLTTNVHHVNATFDTSSPSKLSISLAHETLEAIGELYLSNRWTAYNLPVGTYSLRITALCDIVSVTSITIESGQAIVPSIKIARVEALSNTVTPGGKAGYYVSVDWNVTNSDTLSISAKMNDNLLDSQDYDAQPLQFGSKHFYLSFAAPSTSGTYTVTFNASLLTSGKSSQHVTQLEVEENEYSITVSPDVEYYRTPSTWEWIWGARGRIPIDDPSKLNVLQVTDIEVVDVGLDDGVPVNATVEFVATNKGGSWLSFGDGPHYDIWIEDCESEFLIGTILAGDTETRTATLKVDVSGNLVFTIMYKISWPAEIILLTASIFETYVSIATGGLTQTVLRYLTDIVKLVALYSYKAWTELEHGYMQLKDIGDFLRKFVVRNVELLIEVAEKLYYKNGRNPWLAIFCVLLDAFDDGSIDIGTLVTAGVSLFVWILTRGAANWYKVYEFCFEKAFIRYEVSLTGSWEAGRTSAFFEKLGAVFSVMNLIKIVWDILTKPHEEGKVIDSRIQTGAGVAFDPIFSVNFEGPRSNTTLPYFGDIRMMSIDVKESEGNGQIIYEVNPNMTALYLQILSDKTFQRNALRSCGLNATSTILHWQNGSNVFTIEGNGTMLEDLTKFSFVMNETWIQGYQEMHVYANGNTTTTLFNSSVVYPFGKNLTHTIKLTLPLGSTNIQVLSGGDYTIEGTIITWVEPVDQITVQFTPLLGDVNEDGEVNILDVKLVKLAYSGWIEEPRADLNSDGQINILDVKLIKLAYSGLI